MLKFAQDMMSHYRLMLIVTVLAIASQCIAPSARASVELDFSRFTSNSPTDVAQYLRVSVTDLDNGALAGKVQFDVSWAADTPLEELKDASITKIQIMDGLLGGGTIDVIEPDSGVDFEATINNTAFPNNNLLNFSATFTYESTTEGANSNAVQPGESVGFVFTLKDNDDGIHYVFQDVLDAINNVNADGSPLYPDEPIIRIALHVGTLVDADGSAEGSDQFLSLSLSQAYAPEPGSFLVWLALAGLGMIVSYRPKR